MEKELKQFYLDAAKNATLIVLSSTLTLGSLAWIYKVNADCTKAKDNYLNIEIPENLLFLTYFEQTLAEKSELIDERAATLDSLTNKIHPGLISDEDVEFIASQYDKLEKMINDHSYNTQIFNHMREDSLNIKSLEKFTEQKELLEQKYQNAKNDAIFYSGFGMVGTFIGITSLMMSSDALFYIRRRRKINTTHK